MRNTFNNLRSFSPHSSWNLTGPFKAETVRHRHITSHYIGPQHQSISLCSEFLKIFTCWFYTYNKALHKKSLKSRVNNKMSSLPHRSALSSRVKITRLQFCRIHWQCSFAVWQKLCCNFISKATKENFWQGFCIFSVLFPSPSSPVFAAKRSWETKERDWHGLISIPPPSPPQEERRIVCTKTSPPPRPTLPFWKAAAALWREYSQARQRGWKEELGGRGTGQEAAKRKGTSCTMMLWPMSRSSKTSENCPTHLHVNTGSRRWKWAPALRRSWTCWATGGRRRTAGGWAPSCWTNPTLSYVPSARPRCSFCHRKNTSDYSQVRHVAQASEQQKGSTFRVESQL